MALNTAARRRAASGVPFLPVGPGVTPDAARGPFWRAAAAWSLVPTPVVGAIVAPVWTAESPPDGPAWAAEVGGVGWAAGF